MTNLREQKLYILSSEFSDRLRLGLDVSHLEEEIDQLSWKLVGIDDDPPEFEKVLATCDGFDKAVMAGRWNDAWMLINDFEQKYRSEDGELKVIAWRFVPPIYRRKP